MGSPSYYSHDLAPDPQRRQAAAYLGLRRSDLPGYSTGNRWEQVQHFKDVTYIAVRAVMDLVGGSTFAVGRRKPHRDRTTFGPGGTVAKSAASSTQTGGRDEDYTPFADEDHPLARLVARPNRHETFPEIGAQFVLQNKLTGVAPAWVVPNRAGKPVELHALKAPYVTPLYQISHQYPNGAWRVTAAQGGFAAGSYYGAGAGAVLPGEEVSRFLDPHPWLDWDGFSPLDAGGVHLDVLEALNESRKSAMDNGLQLDTAIVVPGMDQGELDRLARSMAEKAGGSRNARKFLAFAPPAGLGDAKGMIQTFGMSPREMDYSGAWKDETKFALALFGVPALVVDLGDGGYSERYAAWRQFYDRQGNYLSRLATWLTKCLAWPWCEFHGEYTITVTPKPIQDRDFDEQVKGRQLQYDLVTYNEARAKDDLDPVEGGDVPTSIYLKVLEQKMAPQPQPGPPGADAGEQSPDDQDGGDPLAALLGGGGDAPTGGAVPGEDNPDSEGSGVPTIGKAQRVARNEGDKWQSASGQWYQKRSGVGVKIADPNRVKAPTKKDTAARAKQAKQQDAGASRAKVAAVADKLAKGGAGLTHEDVAALHEHLKGGTHHTAAELKAMAKNLGAKLGGAKVELAKRLVEYATAKADGKAAPGAKPAKVEKPKAGVRDRLTGAKVDHADLTDDELAEAVRMYRERKAGAKPAAPAKPAGPAAGGDHVDATEKELRSLVEADKTAPGARDPGHRAAVEKKVADMLAGHTPAEQVELARRVTGEKNVRTPEQAAAALVADATAVSRLVESQDV